MHKRKGKEKTNEVAHQVFYSDTNLQQRLENQEVKGFENTGKATSEDLEISSLPCHFNWTFNEEKFKQRREQNRRSCEETLRQTPDVSVTNFLGYLYFESGEIEKAKHCFKTCLKLFPNNPITLANLACFYQKQGRLKKATEYIARFKKTAPQKQLLWTHWCKAYFHVRLFE